MIYLFLDTGLNFFLRLKMIYVSNSIVYNSYKVKNKYSETTILIWLSRLDALGFSVCYAIWICKSFDMWTYTWMCFGFF